MDADDLCASYREEDILSSMGSESEEYGFDTFSWVKQTAGGVAKFISKSAAAVANELSKLEDDFVTEEAGSFLPLPWELTTNEHLQPSSREDTELKEKILSLSSEDATFLGPYSTKRSRSRNDETNDFVLDDSHIHLVHRLLAIDKNLALAHTRFSERYNLDESVLWQNYFHHCEECKRKHLAGPQVHDGDEGDGDSLVPVESESENETSSYVRVESPPASTGMQSIDSMVLIFQ